MKDKENTNAQRINSSEEPGRRDDGGGAVEDGQKRTQEALRESEARFRSVFEHAAIGMVVVGIEGRFRQVNRAMCDLVGYSEAVLLRKTFQEITHPDDLDADLENMQRMLAGEMSSFQMEKRYIHRDGPIVWILLNASVVHDGDGVPAYFIAQIQDITERKRAEQALQESEERFRRLSEAAFEGIVITEKGVVLDTNDRLAEMLGCPRSDLIGMHVMDFVAPESRELVAGKIASGFETPYEHLALRKDGSTMPVEVQGRTIPFEGHRVRVTAIRDISERKRMEQELIRLERLRALGEMSAGVSHNLNNILTGVIAPAQMLKMATDHPESLKEVDTIIGSALRARELVHRLHLSTRGLEEDTLQPVQVNEIVLEAIRATSPRWKDEPEAKGISIAVVTDLQEAPAIRGTESRLHDIFVNLLFNAVDAMPEGGTITIGTQPVEGGVQVTISDTGIGMDEATRRRVFEPFFTTKMDVGSGLGLSTAYGAVTRWGGALDLESKPGKGSTFTMLLPVFIGEIARAKETREVRNVRSGKLLIVEDEEVVCNVLCRLLSRHHEVEIAQDGEKALEIFAPGRYDVALIDLGMPGMPGDQVLRKMREIDPSLVSVLITGWELLNGDTRLSLFDFRIQKPFEDLNKVMDVIAEAVDLHDERVKKNG